ncbi:MAG: outer membrane protein assembly factor BamD [candidate division KSB1 bacterium]|nr:outer membrane protein assembly factor BamD [candidate division KSB1 bacterium]
MEVRCLIKRLVVCVLAAAFLACGSNKPRANMTTEERFAYALKLFHDKNYFDATTQFRIVILNAPGSPLVDQAQFYLAECHFHRQEFILAASEYEKLIRLYPRSDKLDDAQYKIGLCYDELSPKSDLDQKYTYRAIEAFQRFLEDFPASEYAPEVEKKLFEAREKLAKKEFNTGNLYRKMAYYESAVISFNDVLARFYDTRYAEPAHFYKGQCLFKLQRYNEARETLTEFLQKFPKSKFHSKAQSLVFLLDKAPSTDGTAKK